MKRAGVAAVLATIVLGIACGPSSKSRADPAAPAARPDILLVTLDTTRADAIGPDARGVDTPAFNTIAARGRRFRQAYAAVPETLPSHASIMTGLYPSEHGVRENARYLSGDHPVVAERLRQAGYHTMAFVSAFTLARRFGLSRGFDIYDDALPDGQAERISSQTTAAAVAQLDREASAPQFVWVHYYDPHAPYVPPEPFLSRYSTQPYLGEVAAMDEQLGRLVQAFERHAVRRGVPAAIVVVGDHGEGLGDHGEIQHGHLLYQSTMHVPLVIAGPGTAPGVVDAPVSTRRVCQTLLDWAGLDSAGSLRAASRPPAEAVLGEAMKPFLEYGWQPQVMSVDGRRKSILSARLEVYDVISDPGETQDLATGTPVQTPAALRDYSLTLSTTTRPPDNLGDDARRKLAALGYVSAATAPPSRKDAPRPADMTALFEVIDRASGLFVRGEYGQAIPLLEQILVRDPRNLDATLRLATAHSSLGHDRQAIAAFDRAAAIAPQSADVRTYLALHYARGKGWEKAVPLLERVVTDTPERLPALEALAVLRERQGRIVEASDLRQKIYQLRTPTPLELIQLGQLAMSAQRTPLAIEAFERARMQQGASFTHDLELGVLYLEARRLPDARAALDRVPPSHPGYPMALFKRAQVSVLLNEPDQAARIDLARRRADATTRELIAKERLFLRRQ